MNRVIIDDWSDFIDYINKHKPADTTTITREEVEQKINALVDSAPSDLDTLRELANRIISDYSQIPTKTSQLTNDSSFISELSLDSFAKKTDIPTKISSFENDKNYLTEHQSLKDYPTIEQVNNELTIIDSSIFDIKNNMSAIESSILLIDSSLALTAKTSDMERLVSQLTTRIAILESSNTSMKYADSADVINSISDSDAKTTDLVITSSEAVSSLDSNKTFKSIVIVGGESDNSILVNATNSIIIDGLQINGLKDAGNGKVNYMTPELTIKNAIINVNNSNYNVFEGSLKPTDSTTLNTNITVDNMLVDGENLTHNVINVYTPATGAKIIIKDSSFDLNVACSNVLRISNTPNSDNVEILFENVDWNYENYSANVAESDWKWAGLVIYQPYGSDVAYTSNDLSHIATWKFTFKNCKYNGIKVTENNFGEHNAVVYSYNIGGTKTVADLSAIGATFSFE